MNTKSQVLSPITGYIFGNVIFAYLYHSKLYQVLWSGESAKTVWGTFCLICQALTGSSCVLSRPSRQALPVDSDLLGVLDMNPPASQDY